MRIHENMKGQAYKRNISSLWRRLTHNRMSHFDRSFKWPERERAMPPSLVLKRGIKAIAKSRLPATPMRWGPGEVFIEPARHWGIFPLCTYPLVAALRNRLIVEAHTANHIAAFNVILSPWKIEENASLAYIYERGAVIISAKCD